MNELTPKQQTVELIQRAKNVLIVTHRNPDGDALGSLISLKIVLEKLGKKVAVACPDQPISLFSFLPRVDEITTAIEMSKDLVVSIDLSHAKVEKIGYKKDEDRNLINIVIVPKEGQFEESDVKVKKAGPQYDLIIVADTPNFERLGKLALPTDIFYEVPVVNIDHHPSNERYGKVNWVELVATSTAEILVSLFEALGHGDTSLIDKDVATALLTGLIYDTSSFQNVNTTPKSLTVAAQLVAAGARQQEIIKNLYKTKTLETLKLWGLVLSNVKEDKQNRFLWSSVTKQDVEKAGADESALSGVVDELLKTATDVDFAMLISERDGQIHGSLRSIAKGVNVAQIAELFGGGGHEVASAFRMDGKLTESENNILNKIRQFQSKSPNFSKTDSSSYTQKADAKTEPKEFGPSATVDPDPIISEKEDTQTEQQEKVIPEAVKEELKKPEINEEKKPDLEEEPPERQTKW